MTKKTEQMKIPSSNPYFNCSAWYLRERTPVNTVQDRRTRKYFALEERTNSDGFKGEVLVEKDYPFTPEYVSSFAASSDYRSDPLGAIVAAPQRRNLGDVTQLQNALGLDFETARHLYAEFRAAAARAAQKKAEQGTPASAPASAGKEGNS